jgi:hypothetical protein
MSRFAATLFGVACSVAAFAQEPFPGAKADLAGTQGGSPSATSNGLMPLFQMAVAAAVILVFLKVWMPKIVSRMNKRLSPTTGGGIRIEESATFAAGTLYIANVRGKSLLLCASQQGVTCLADLTENAPKPEEAAFADVLQRESDAERIEARTEPRPPGDVAAALQRAERLLA